MASVAVDKNKGDVTMNLKDMLTIYSIINGGNLVYKDLVDKAIESAKSGKRYCEREYDASRASTNAMDEFFEDFIDALENLERQGINCRWTRSFGLGSNIITVYMEW